MSEYGWSRPCVSCRKYYRKSSLGICADCFKSQNPGLNDETIVMESAMIELGGKFQDFANATQERREEIKQLLFSEVGISVENETHRLTECIVVKNLTYGQVKKLDDSNGVKHIWFDGRVFPVSV